MTAVCPVPEMEPQETLVPSFSAKHFGKIPFKTIMEKKGNFSDQELT